MKSFRHIPLYLVTAATLSACTTSSLLDTLPDRRPDYRHSEVKRKIEVPPDLSAEQLDDALTISDFNSPAVVNYSSYKNANLRRGDKTPPVQVLPSLYRVQIKEPTGQLPYLIIEADPETAWQAVKKYWQDNAIHLAIEKPDIGIMETDWLENKSDMPQTGISGLLNSFLGFLGDSDERNRYRIRFTRVDAKHTEVLLIHSQSEQVAEYDFQSGKEPAGFKWQLSANKDPELQLEMTRRLALFVSAELKRASELPAQTASAEKQTTTRTPNAPRSITLSQLSDGRPALMLAPPYAEAWRVLGIGLDKASFAIISNDYQTGRYKVRYTPQPDKPSLFSRIFSSAHKPTTQTPEYLVRLGEQGERLIAVVQNTDGTAAQADAARALLEAVRTAL